MITNVVFQLSDLVSSIIIMSIKGGRGVRRLMEKSILNFHFDYGNASLSKNMSPWVPRHGIPQQRFESPENTAIRVPIETTEHLWMHLC